MVVSFVRLLAASFLALPIIASALSAATPTTFNPTGVTLNLVAYTLDVTVSAPLPETNAKRFSRGLGPKAPVRRVRNCAADPRPSHMPPSPAAPTGVIVVTIDSFVICNFSSHLSPARATAL
ncbi:hypothetical protein EUX98_g8691 [Antrodiella citrinella]|uniref:Uncharacterized protein n=1 Tax=Antrodiella citrinella TaxID=2447956 RepID=A0A4S4M6C3_9APHY|nr:hypothetical protein EUX98_g8691 [Antrodiella citrinella]